MSLIYFFYLVHGIFKHSPTWGRDGAQCRGVFGCRLGFLFISSGLCCQPWCTSRHQTIWLPVKGAIPHPYIHRRIPPQFGKLNSSCKPPKSTSLILFLDKLGSPLLPNQGDKKVRSIYYLTPKLTHPRIAQSGSVQVPNWTSQWKIPLYRAELTSVLFQTFLLFLGINRLFFWAKKRGFHHEGWTDFPKINTFCTFFGECKNKLLKYRYQKNQRSHTK